MVCCLNQKSNGADEQFDRSSALFLSVKEYHRLKQIGMCSGTNKIKNQPILFNFINQKPIRIDVTLLKTGIIACQFVIFIFLRKRLSVRKETDDFDYSPVSYPRFSIIL